MLKEKEISAVLYNCERAFLIRNQNNMAMV